MTPSRQTKRQSILSLSCLVCLLITSPNADAVEPVAAELSKDSVWTGEAVPLIVTLYSPGPFSGTASFDFPEMPQTMFVRGDGPVVASETIDGETFFTQRHVLTLYTQRFGTIEIPPFRVRFAGKPSFTSAAEPIEGFTPKLKFESKRPPGTEEFDFVVTATTMEVAQTWVPETDTQLTPGDVIERTITRNATGTSAMMIPPVSTVASDGVRIYKTDPVVQDHSQRGNSTAERNETIKYQFERSGTFDLPDLTIVWWDADGNRLQRVELKGRTFNVEGDALALQGGQESEPASASTTRFVVSAIVVALGILILWMLIPRLGSKVHDGEALAAARLRSACDRNDPHDAYHAFLVWKGAIIEKGYARQWNQLLHGECQDFSEQIDGLARRLFGEAEPDQAWSGKGLAKSFADARGRTLRIVRVGGADGSLPALNPTVTR